MCVFYLVVHRTRYPIASSIRQKERSTFLIAPLFFKLHFFFSERKQLIHICRSRRGESCSCESYYVLLHFLFYDPPRSIRLHVTFSPSTLFLIFFILDTALLLRGIRVLILSVALVLVLVAILILFLAALVAK